MTTSRTRAAAALALVLTTSLAGCSPAGAPETADPTRTATASADSRAGEAVNTLRELEGRYDATLGVYAVDTGSGRSVGYRADDRFAYASTSKVLLAGALLATATDADLGATIHYGREDLVSYSPVTEAHVDDGLSLREVIAAALQQSDNTAANLMFRELGGPPALQAKLRSLGDATTQVARTEPELNEAEPGDDRDTSTPRALAADLRAFALGDALTEDRRKLLLDDLTGNATGDPLIRAGLPASWTVADKSGAASYGTRNDIAVVQVPGRAPIVMVVLSRKAAQEATYDNALIADAAHVLARAFG